MSSQAEPPQNGFRPSEITLLITGDRETRVQTRIQAAACKKVELITCWDDEMTFALLTGLLCATHQHRQLRRYVCMVNVVPWVLAHCPVTEAPVPATMRLCRVSDELKVCHFSKTEQGPPRQYDDAGSPFRAINGVKGPRYNSAASHELSPCKPPAAAQHLPKGADPGYACPFGR